MMMTGRRERHAAYGRLAAKVSSPRADGHFTRRAAATMSFHGHADDDMPSRQAACRCLDIFISTRDSHDDAALEVLRDYAAADDIIVRI